MKQRNLALSLAVAAFSTLAALPAASQAADGAPSQQCQAKNEVHVRFGLPTVSCANAAKAADGVMGQIRSMNTPSERCNTNNEVRARHGLPTLACAAKESV